jgi:hypothetical protein
MSSLLEGSEEIIELLDPSLLPVEKLTETYERMKQLLEESYKRRAERMKRREDEDFDDEEAQALEVGSSVSVIASHVALASAGRYQCHLQGVGKCGPHQYPLVTLDVLVVLTLFCSRPTMDCNTACCADAERAASF